MIKMVYTRLVVWCPHVKMAEATQIFAKAEEEMGTDPSVTRIITLMKAGKEGMRSTTIAKVNDGKLKDALVYTHKYMERFLVVEGLNYDVELENSLEEMAARAQSI